VLRPHRPGRQPEAVGRALRQRQHVRLLLLPRRAHADAEHGDAAVQPDEARHQPRLRARAAGGVDQVVDLQAHLRRLVTSSSAAVT
jgi:hypothetical protein